MIFAIFTVLGDWGVRGGFSKLGIGLLLFQYFVSIGWVVLFTLCMRWLGGMSFVREL